MVDIREYPREHWRDFLRRLNIAQGEHTLIIGPTSSGKTALARQVIETTRDGYVMGLFVKGKDKTADDEWLKNGWVRLKGFPKRGLNKKQRRVIIWPDLQKHAEETHEVQKGTFKAALDWANYVGNVAVYADETSYLMDLGLVRQVNQLFYLARSNGTSAYATMQRPKFVPRVLMSNSSHAFIARTTDRDDIKRLSDLGGGNAKELEHNMLRLTDRHDFIYVNPLGDAPPSIVNTRR